MTDYRQPKRKKHVSGARNRQRSRLHRQKTVTSLRNESANVARQLTQILPGRQSEKTKIGDNADTFQDVVWQFAQHIPVMKILAGAIVFAFLLFFGYFFMGGRIFPSIWTMDVPLGGYTVDEAEERLNDAWFDEIELELVAGDELIMTVAPTDLGLELDARATAEAAKAAGATGIPFGVGIKPVIDVRYGVAQSYLLSITDRVDIPAYEAGYEWRDGQIFGAEGQPSRELDIARTIEVFSRDPARMIKDRQFELVTSSTPPNVVDPTPYLDEAYDFVTSGFQLVGYDPFEHEFIPWTTTQEVIASWLAAGNRGLTLRDNELKTFIRALNRNLQEGEDKRYLDEDETFAFVREAIEGGDRSTFLRIRYLPTEYTIARGDSGFEIGRKRGLPFLLINDVNPGVEWEALTIGQTLQLPSPDDLIREDPIPGKRIVVDLERLWLVAFENDEIVFQWQISDGRSSAPTYPGIYQILEKVDVAYGSSFSLCNDEGTDCGQWAMNAFMGIYEVTPGLMNGFHGAVTLPNGGYLGGGNTGNHSTFGCVMSENGNAELLYEWADIGTMVEIISEDFDPKSHLGEQALEFIKQQTGIL